MRIFLSLILILVCSTAYAEEFILPKSFSIDKNNLPVITTEGNIVTVSVKKQALTPATNISLGCLVKNFEYDYENTFNSTLSTLLQLNIIPVDFDSTRGQIRARLKSGKELFIFLLPSKAKMTHVRITPANGRYDIPTGLIDNIFKTLGQSLYIGV